MAPRVVIGVVTWRGYDVTRACLESLQRIDEWPIPTVVIDNGSGTGEGGRLAAEFGAPIEWIDLGENGGVPAGYNAAMTWALAQGATHVLLLNNDTLINDPAMLTRLLHVAATEVAVVGPVILDRDGFSFSAGGTLDWTTGRSGHLVRPAHGASGAYEVDWTDGSCMLVALAAAKAIGGFAPEYFMYWEETDWCARARRAGFLCLVEPSTSIVHLRGTSKPSARAVRQLRRNAILFMRRNGSRASNVTSLGYFLTLGALWEAFVAWRTGLGVRQSLCATGAAVAWNLRDAASRRRWRLAAAGPPVSGDRPTPARDVGVTTGPPPD